MRDFTSEFAVADIRENKWMAILSYLSFLLIIPLFLRKNSPYTRFHVNQGLILFIIAVALNVVHWLIQWLLSFFIFLPVLIVIDFAFAVINILILTMIVIGVLNVVSERARELPLIGQVRLLK